LADAGLLEAHGEVGADSRVPVQHPAGPASLTLSQRGRVLFQFQRAAKELWKFCTLGRVEIAASSINDRSPDDWWVRGAPRLR
jgi:hypothetical protein